MASLPKPGALIHVLIQPFITDREVEVLDQDGELRMGGAEEGEEPLQELGRHEVLGGEAAIEVVEASGQEVVEAIDRAGRSIHGMRWKGAKRIGELGERLMVLFWNWVSAD